MDDYPLLGVFWTTMWFFLWILWFALLFRVIADLFRDDSLSGGAKAGWSVLVIVLPFIGVFAYLAVRGGGMGDRETNWHRRRGMDHRHNMLPGSVPAGQAGALERLVDLKNHGDLSADEYERAKAKVLAG
ncbi:SHOCT domain-containing protein [Actinomadura sp. NTSP31]|uniref:SHOCT domain-containing protein n=1 Tax=Actinomadura sp. NTSP31 TaxID=1735447 RepID=UPI0035C0CE09